MRREEIAPLLYEDIDIDNRLITINKAVHWEKNRPFVKKTKNEEARKIPILDVIYDKVKELKEQHKDKDLLVSSAKSKEIMSETSIKRLLEHTLYQMNKLYRQNQIDTLKSVSDNENLEESDIKTIEFTYHQLRHTYVCMLHKAGIPLKEAQSLTGHKTLGVLLNIYTHLDEEDKENATNKLNNLIKI